MTTIVQTQNGDTVATSEVALFPYGISSEGQVAAAIDQMLAEGIGAAEFEKYTFTVEVDGGPNYTVGNATDVPVVRSKDNHTIGSDWRIRTVDSGKVFVCADFHSPHCGKKFIVKKITRQSKR